ncbi:Uncharacterized protein APZ42_010516 [Daphnia magna]|jgi:hypothetical protein|uniref:Uncharacterized protein n=1 Tax=Daphnia magna TaxID=35525 RepID=A0A162CX20_9CRUS|nr:Uncharacterized protein APZ42_010516 [Daphnia magna]
MSIFIYIDIKYQHGRAHLDATYSKAAPVLLLIAFQLDDAY